MVFGFRAFNNCGNDKSYLKVAKAVQSVDMAGALGTADRGLRESQLCEGHLPIAKRCGFRLAVFKLHTSIELVGVITAT